MDALKWMALTIALLSPIAFGSEPPVPTTEATITSPGLGGNAETCNCDVKIAQGNAFVPVNNAEVTANSIFSPPIRPAGSGSTVSMNEGAR